MKYILFGVVVLGLLVGIGIYPRVPSDPRYKGDEFYLIIFQREDEAAPLENRTVPENISDPVYTQAGWVDVQFAWVVFGASVEPPVFAVTLAKGVYAVPRFLVAELRTRTWGIKV